MGDNFPPHRVATIFGCFSKSNRFWLLLQKQPLAAADQSTGDFRYV